MCLRTQVAQYLESQPQIEKVFYPGLPSHPDYNIACGQMEGFGGVLRVGRVFVFGW